MFGLTISLADYVVMFKGSKRLWWVTRISNNNYRLGPASRRPATKVSVAKVLGNVMADAGTQNGNIIIMNHECCRWNWGLPKKASPYSAARAADVILIVSPVLLKNQDYIKSRQHNSNSHKKKSFRWQSFLKFHRSSCMLRSLIKVNLNNTQMGIDRK